MVSNIRSTNSLIEEEQVATGGSGFLEKNLSDFFDIQIFSTVYFGSRNEPH